MREPAQPAGEERPGPAANLREAALGPPAQTPLGRAAQVSVQVLLVAAAIALVAFVLVRLRLVVLPVIAAIFLATLLMPVADWLRRRGFPDALAALCVMLAALGLVGGIVALLAPPVTDEFGAVGDSLREGLATLGSALANLGVSEAEIDRGIDNALETLREQSGGIGRGVLSGALLLVEIVAGLLLMLVLLFFFLKDGDRIWRWVVGLLPAGRREDAREVGRRSSSALGHYLRGVTLVATVDAVLIGIALAVLGVPLVLPLAVLIFFGAFFPLVGAIAAGFVAALVALVSEGVVTALILVGVIAAVQQLEGNFIYPVVVGRAIRLHPVGILLALTAGAVVGGVVGALFAVPLATVAWTAVAYFRREGGPPEVVPAASDG